MLSSSELPEGSTSEISPDADVSERYAYAAAQFQQSEARARGSAVGLRHARGSADEKARSLGRTFDFFAIVALALFGVAVFRATTIEQPVPAIIVLAWLLPCASLFLLNAASKVRFKALGARAAAVTRMQTVVPQRRRWLLALGELARSRSGSIADDVSTKVDGHLKADDLMREKENRKLPWPARSHLFGAHDVTSERFPFFVDLVRWITLFVFVVAALFLVATTVMGFEAGMAVNGAALLGSAVLRLVVTYAALVARSQRVDVLEQNRDMWSMVTSQDDDLVALGRDLQQPVIDLRSRSANRFSR